MGTRLLVFVISIAALVPACAHHDTLAIGEALTVGDRRVAPAVALEAARGTGSSDHRGSSFAEGRARVLVGPTRQQIAGLAGVSRLAWVGARAPLWAGLGVGPAIERFSGKGFFEAVFQARLGTAFVLGQVVEPFEPLDPWGVNAPDVDERWPRPGPRAPLVVRRRLLLTLGLTADVDARFTRGPLYVAALMLGVSQLEELVRAPP